MAANDDDPSLIRVRVFVCEECMNFFPDLTAFEAHREEAGHGDVVPLRTISAIKAKDKIITLFEFA